MILVDAGPLVALVKGDDHHHAECASVFRTLNEPMGTVWPVLTEVMHFMGEIPRAQDKIWELVARGTVEILPLGLGDLPRIRELMLQYSNRPMDLADAALIRVGEREGIRRFFTIDRKDFAVYRLHGKTRPSVIP